MTKLRVVKDSEAEFSIDEAEEIQNEQDIEKPEPKVIKPRQKSETLISLRKHYPVHYFRVIRRNVRKLVFLFLFGVSVSSLLVHNPDEAQVIYEIFGTESFFWFCWCFTIFGFAFLSLAYETLRFITYDYYIDSQNLSVVKGVLARNKIIVPYSHIMEIVIEQDILDMVFGLYDLHISTAAHDPRKLAYICGLSRQNAEQITALLLKKVNVSQKMDFSL